MQQIGLYLLCFVTILILELPDKTSLVLLSLAQHGKLRVWLGAVAAFSLQALIGVLAGMLLKVILGAWLHIIAAVGFIGFGLWLWRDANDQSISSTQSTSPHIFWTSFILVFLAEFGDLTQLTIATWATKLHNIFLVWVISSLALALAGLISVNAGSYFAQKWSMSRLKRGSALLFFGIALAMFLGL